MRGAAEMVERSGDKPDRWGAFATAQEASWASWTTMRLCLLGASRWNARNMHNMSVVLHLAGS